MPTYQPYVNLSSTLSSCRSIDAKVSPLGGGYNTAMPQQMVAPAPTMATAQQQQYSTGNNQMGPAGSGGGYSLPPGVTSMSGAGGGGFSQTNLAGVPPGLTPISGPPPGVTPLAGLPPGITSFPNQGSSGAGNAGLPPGITAFGAAAVSGLPPGVTAAGPNGSFSLQQQQQMMMAPVGAISGGGAAMAAMNPGPVSGGGAGPMSGGGFDASGVVGGLNATEAKMLADRISTMQREHEAALSKIRAEASRAQVGGEARL